MDRVAFAALLMLIFTIPLENALIIPGFGTLGRLIGLLAMGIGAITVILSNSKLRIHAIHVLTLLFIVTSTVTYYWSESPIDTLERTWTYLQLLAMMWLVFQFTDTENRMMRVYQAFGIGVLVLTMGIIMGSGDLTDDHYRATSYNFNPNDIASIIALGIPISWYVYLKKKETMLGKIFVVISLSGFLGILLTGSRAGLIKGMLGLAFILFSPALSTKKRFFIFSLAGAALFASVFFVPPETWQRLSSLQSEIAAGDLGGRLGIWAYGWKIFAENPIFGIGTGMFSIHSQSYFSTSMAPHNVFISVMVEQGVVGLIAFLLIVFTVIFSIVRLDYIDKWFLAVFFLIWFLSAMTSNWEWRKQTWLIFILIVNHASLFTRDKIDQNIILWRSENAKN